MLNPNDLFKAAELTAMLALFMYRELCPNLNDDALKREIFIRASSISPELILKSETKIRQLNNELRTHK